MINIGVIVAIVIGLFSVGGIVTYLIYKKRKFRFDFRVWAKDLSSSRIVKARITANKENKNKKEFTFKTNPSVLTMRDPVHYSGGRPERWALPDESGEYQYLSPVNKLFKREQIEIKDKDGNITLADNPIDKEVYMKTRLHPVNRQLALEQFRNNQKRYDVGSGVVAGMVFGGILLAILLAVGIIYSTGSMLKYGESISDNVKAMRDTSANNNAAMLLTVEALSETTNNLGYIYGQLNGNVSVVRPVDGFRP